MRPSGFTLLCARQRDAQCRNRRHELKRGRGLESDGSAIAELRDGEVPGVQQRVSGLQSAAERGVSHAAMARTAVEIVADDRISRVRQMNSQLVGSSCGRSEHHDAREARTAENRVRGESGASGRVDSHAPAIAAIGAERPGPAS